MDLALDPSVIVASLLIPLQIVVVNLLLSADNALVFAMACRSLPAAERATLLDIVGAIVLPLAKGSIAIAQGRLVYIALGIPMLIWGSNRIRELLDESGLPVLASGGFLGWVAGGAVADPMIAPSVAAYAPADRGDPCVFRSP